MYMVISFTAGEKELPGVVSIAERRKKQKCEQEFNQSYGLMANAPPVCA
jgi:hypothetical protein